KRVKGLKGLDMGNGTVIAIITSHETSMGSEGYRLTIAAQRITLTGSGAGVFYGVQTLLQLISGKDKETCILPCVEIEDSPRFAYRGFMLDVARHFYSVDQVKQVLDLMARYKLNTFHWHLT